MALGTAGPGFFLIRLRAIAAILPPQLLALTRKPGIQISSRLLLHGGHHMAVRVQRDANGRVTNAALYFLNFVSWARVEGVSYLYFEAFDETWKAAYEGPQGAHWGVWDKYGNLKPGMQNVFDGATIPDNWSGSSVGGVGDLPEMAPSSAPNESPAIVYAPLVGLAIVGLAGFGGLTAVAWYAKRRWLR
jgi:hypothetical protein